MNPVPARRRLVPQGAQELWVEISGHKMRYLTAGSGPPLILLPGLMGFSFSWSENILPLSQCFTVYAPDLLNTGYSDRCPLPTDLQSGANQILAFMDAVQVSKADLMGSSYGGTLAMAVAAIALERIQRMVLVSPSHPASEVHPRWQYLLFGNAFGARVADAFLPLAPQFIFGFFLRRMYGDTARVLPGSVREYTKAMKMPGTIVAAARILKDWKSNFQKLTTWMPRLEQVPAFLIWGDRDPVVPLKTANSLHHLLKRSSLRIIAGAGHLPYEELPEEFNRIVLDYCCHNEHAPSLADEAPPPVT